MKKKIKLSLLNIGLIDLLFAKMFGSGGVPVKITTFQAILLSLMLAQFIVIVGIMIALKILGEV